MQNLSTILNNHVLIVAIAASLISQFIKLLIEIFKNKKFNLRVLVGTGGMPSAHSALVSALATGVGQESGWDSIEFAIATLFAVIVMYDAAGVRQAAGKQARILNQIIDELFEVGKEFNEDRLKELLGHTPFQVIVGLFLGIAIACLARLTY
ncbi:MAG: divergent PAP2 family protein [Coleofasciculaceae cyanobacterium SM2_1_6]|nr:divergent PAP2 family protein [Coleofasciculaceae cyanobacterium SM2_1_6]